MSSTWPTGVFTSGPSSPHLTVDQANSLFKLATECQALSVKLAKQFQVLWGLEAMHCNSIQGMAHETLTLGCSAREATYSAILHDRVSEDEHEATTRHLRSEADAAWKEMHEVMYNHQLQYDQQLTTFLTEAKMALNDMQGELWAAVRTLAKNEGITFDACLGIALQVLNLLPQLPIDILFQTQIPLTIAYCPESSIYRRWCPEQGRWCPDGEEGQERPHTQNTLTGVSQVFGGHKDTDPESSPREKIQSIQRKWHPKSPQESSPLKESSKSSSSEEEPSTDEALHDGARQKAWLLDTRFEAWHCNKIARGIAGWVARDTMICDLPEHGKMQPNQPNPMGPSLSYMGECQVFDSIWSNIYDLCRFYALGMNGDLPEFPAPREPATHNQVRDLLKSARSIG